MSEVYIKILTDKYNRTKDEKRKEKLAKKILRLKEALKNGNPTSKKGS